MPELSLEASDLIDSLQIDKVQYLYPPSENELQKKAELYEEEYIGSGDESIVLASGERVQAYSYKGVSPEVAKLIFYKQRIMSTLFPHNFPHFFASFGSLGKSSESYNQSGSIRQKIEMSKSQQISFPFESVVEICSEWNIPLDTDPAMHNVATGTDGGEYYLDTLAVNYEDPLKYSNAVLYAQDHNYSQEDIRILLFSAQRIAELSYIAAQKVA